MFRIILMDTEPQSRIALREQLKKYNIDVEIILADQVEQVRFYASNIAIDCFVLALEDYYIPVLQLAKGLRNKTQYAYTPIVFISKRPDFMSLAYLEARCCEYILKPFRDDAFAYLAGLINHIQTINQHIQGSQEALVFHLPKEYVHIPADQIVFIESYNRKCLIHTYKEDYIVPTTLRDLLAEHPCKMLVQSHRSYIINLQHVRHIRKEVEPWCVYFDAYNQNAYVSRNYKKQVDEALFQYL